MNANDFRNLALALPQVEEHEHFGKPSFRVGTKIFATLWWEENRGVLKLSPQQQVELCSEYSNAFAPVPGAWGGKGWTSVFLDHAERDVLTAALKIAWQNVAPKSLQK
jgi:predicted DNA-binding protein (MmcQ/YjbR family)